MAKKRSQPTKQGSHNSSNSTDRRQCEVIVEDKKPAAAADVDEDDYPQCPICFENVSSCRAITPCGHNDICGTCHLRLRYLHNDKKCPICKTDNDRIIVDEDAEDGTFKNYSDYEIWGDEIGPNYTYRSDVQMHFTKVYHENSVAKLFSMDCGVEGCKDHLFRNNKQPKKLFTHLRSKHGRFLCKLCVDHKRDFISMLPRFTAAQLRNHEQNGDGPESGFKQHPMCKFCKPKRFYDLMYLHEHLNKEHYKCHICEKDGKKNQFFKDYNSLQKHFDRAHFLCHDPQCLMARFVVFSTEIDLRSHEIDVHGATNRDSRIKFEFQVRRSGFDGSGVEEQETPSSEDFQYGLDGEVFVPDDLPNQEQHIQENEPEITDELHAARTAEIRRNAAQIRSQNMVEEAFPSLNVSSTESATTAMPASGWGGNRGSRTNAMAAENFPALVGVSKKKKKQWGQQPARPNNSVNWRSSSGFQAAQPTSRKLKVNQPVIRSAAVTSNPMTSRTGSSWGVSSSRNNTSMSGENFPSLQTTQSPYAAARSLAEKNKKKVINSKKNPTSNAMSNMLVPPLPSTTLPKLSEEEARAKLDAMKLYLGQKDYKKIKSLTKQFAGDMLDPETYVLNTSELFNGMSDPKFFELMPALISSCPNEKQAMKAMRYLRRQQN